MYGPIRPLPYKVFRERLEGFSVIECGENDDGIGGCCRVLRLMRMGLGTGEYYNFAHDGNDGIVPEPEIISVLNFFGIEHADFMLGCRSGDSD